MGIRPFEKLPYTEVHNYALDVIMPSLSANGWKILCVALRQTQGWVDENSPTGRKEEDQISYSQFQEKTGIRSRTTVSRAVHECLEAGYLLRREIGKDPRSGLPLYAYSLNTEYEVGEEQPFSSPENEPPSSPENGLLNGPENEPLASSPENGLHSSPKNEPLSSPENGHTKEKKERNKHDDGGGDSTKAGRVALLLELAQAERKPLDLALAHELVEPYTLEQVAGLVAYVRQATGLRDPLAFAISRLRSGDLPKVVMPEPARPVNQRDCQGCGESYYLWDLCRGCGRCEACCQCAAEVVDPVLAESRQVWEAALGELALQMTRGTFNTWLKPTRVLARENGVFTIGVANGHVKDWLENRLQATILRTLQGIVKEDVEVQFVVEDVE